MFTIILAAIFAVIGLVFLISRPKLTGREIPGREPQVVKIGKFGLVPLAIAALLFGVKTFTIIDAGEVGVPVVFGNVQPTLQEGFNVHNPFAVVHRMSIREERHAATIPAKANDNGQIGVDYSVLYSLMPADAGQVYARLGVNYAEKIVPQIAGEVLRDEIGKHTTEGASRRRSEIAAAAEDQLRERLAGYGLAVRSIELQNLDLPNQVEAGIEAKLAAEQEAQAQQFRKQKAEQEAEIALIDAHATAEADRILAEGISPALLMRMQIEAFREAFAAGNGVIYLPGNGDGSTFSFLQDPSAFADVSAGRSSSTPAPSPRPTPQPEPEQGEDGDEDEDDQRES